VIDSSSANRIVCTDDPSACGGGETEGYGCPAIYCEPGINDLGTCDGCDNQVSEQNIIKYCS
jgi:hypothetical protein